MSVIVPSPRMDYMTDLTQERTVKVYIEISLSGRLDSILEAVHTLKDVLNAWKRYIPVIQKLEIRSSNLAEAKKAMAAKAGE